MSRKILVSRGFGVGWSTWSSKPQEVAEYYPIIRFLLDGVDRLELTEDHELVQQMVN